MMSSVQERANGRRKILLDKQGGKVCRHFAYLTTFLPRTSVRNDIGVKRKTILSTRRR